MTTNQCINGTREIKHYQFVACCCFALFCFVLFVVVYMCVGVSVLFVMANH